MDEDTKKAVIAIALMWLLGKLGLTWPGMIPIPPKKKPPVTPTDPGTPDPATPPAPDPYISPDPVTPPAVEPAPTPPIYDPDPSPVPIEDPLPSPVPDPTPVPEPAQDPMPFVPPYPAPSIDVTPDPFIPPEHIESPPIIDQPTGIIPFPGSGILEPLTNQQLNLLEYTLHTGGMAAALATAGTFGLIASPALMAAITGLTAAAAVPIAAEPVAPVYTPSAPVYTPPISTPSYFDFNPPAPSLDLNFPADPGHPATDPFLGGR